ncbi:MAG: tRNA (adenosine(37)-N6)-threonylcarbamoyltransferase complex transferase subunit TsaD [Magnetococcales bacterium]|nr:tRNA (adenosine(37)-N6)-threonylcarbamoyltransferase complex transferase subunit TsaD [Magnetococcales bacterium]NGZ27492.1 tRNA (adenosine(37)-N6)-threonylcarbamoyltransferase complex transferase subunit TsaD [Magnetococcales bacterium]
MRVLGIETSCDETSAAVLTGEGEDFRLLSSVIHSQIEVHAPFGGVVPELASRQHIRNIQPVVEEALDRAGITARELHGIAVTAGPGLVGALLVGVVTAKAMALALEIPLVGIHHLEGHLMTPFLTTPLEYPFIALLVSGGHSQILLARGFGDYRLLGQTRDDAAGEAFDKGAKMLGLGYPGGPAVARQAEGGNPRAIPFPRAMMEKGNHDFSFSGLKTALRNHLHQHPSLQGEALADVAASYQEAIVEALAVKAILACRQFGCHNLAVAGGVGANGRLRQLLAEMAQKANLTLTFPPLAFCTDNAAMIALAGWQRLRRGEHHGSDLDARARWPFAQPNPTP